MTRDKQLFWDAWFSAGVALFLLVGSVGGFFYILKAAFGAEQIRCTFDRNEIGPKGTYGQWWWDIYKCTDGTERRELVAGPRG